MEKVSYREPSFYQELLWSSSIFFHYQIPRYWLKSICSFPLQLCPDMANPSYIGFGNAMWTESFLHFSIPTIIISMFTKCFVMTRPVYHGAPMLDSLSCRRSSRLKISLNLFSYVAMKAQFLIFYYKEKIIYYKGIKPPQFHLWFSELYISTYSFKDTKDCISKRILSTTASHMRAKSLWMLVLVHIGLCVCHLFLSQEEF